MKLNLHSLLFADELGGERDVFQLVWFWSFLLDDVFAPPHGIAGLPKFWAGLVVFEQEQAPRIVRPNDLMPAFAHVLHLDYRLEGAMAENQPDCLVNVPLMQTSENVHIVEAG